MTGQHRGSARSGWHVSGQLRKVTRLLAEVRAQPRIVQARFWLIVGVHVAGAAAIAVALVSLAVTS